MIPVFFDSFQIIYFFIIIFFLILHNIYKDRILTRLTRLLQYVYKIHGVMTGEKNSKDKDKHRNHDT